MTEPKNFPNPFYVMLVIVGLLFAVTACAYGAMSTYYAVAVQRLSAEEAAAIMENESSWMALLDKHGITLMLCQLAVLAMATFAAIATDRWWKKT